jgi:hypothetical protein
MKFKFEDLVGKRFGRLVVEGYMGDGRWWCNCDCGGTAITRTDGLKSGHTKSCGCLHKESITKHGFWNTDYSKGTMKFYKMWQNLKARCDNKNHKSYKNYGGRGITYSKKWKDFLGFKEDMYFKYLYAVKQQKLKGTSIERIDVDGNYCRKNCTFIELEGQLKNSRTIVSFIAISPDGKEFNTKNVNEFSKKYDLNSSHVYECLKGKSNHHKGWTFKLIKN